MGQLKAGVPKPLQVNPIKLTQPMGATLAFLGVHGCMPLMHGAQGCTSLIKVFFTRHYSEPIAIQTTAVTDAIAVLDGGDYSIIEAVKNITQKVTPCLIGLHSTGLTETKGDDLRRVAAQIDFPLVSVNTPDYEGGLESGWALTCKALIEQLVDPCDKCDKGKLVLLPHVSLTPIEVEKLKEFVATFGLQAVALPDLSTSLDGHLGEKQAALSSGGTTVQEIHGLAEASLVISIGDSMQDSAAALLQKNPGLRHQHFAHLHGLEASDALVELLMRESGRSQPPAAVTRWRQRLQDVLLDSHFTLGQTDILLTGEPDQLAGLSQALGEAGARIAAVVAAGPSPQLQQIRAGRVEVGDLEDAESLAAAYTLIVGNSHCVDLAHRLNKQLVVRGFPNWEQIGHPLKNDILYEGGCSLLCEVANIAAEPFTHAQPGRARTCPQAETESPR